MRFDLFSSGRLYTALQEAGYPDLPAERTLRDWIKNDSAPTGARLFVANLLELDTTEAAPPEWAGRLMTSVEAVAQKIGVTDADRAEAERLVLAELRGAAPPPR